MFVRAYDLGIPQRTSNTDATVRINVIRNQNCPVFNNLPADITISQSQNTNTRVYNVSATDLDTAVSFYFLCCNNDKNRTMNKWHYFILG